jgi:diacylglycerol kinase family enzyme
MLADAVRSAAALRPDAIVVGGGDGSMGAAAGVLAGCGIPLGVLPLGAFNHFARDLRIPRRIEDAVAVIARGSVRAIDVGEVNERVFVNNSTMGVYAGFVRHRNSRRLRAESAGWLSVLYGLWHALRAFPSLNVCLEMDYGSGCYTTPFLFVGNNDYDRGLFSSLGGRSSLDRGRLFVYVARCTSRLDLARLVLDILTGRSAKHSDVHSMLVREFTVRSSERLLLTTADGEVWRMQPPAHYRIRPKALRVILPEDNQPS